jgi:tetratricopeptide (TPR) repeat protein
LGLGWTLVAWSNLERQKSRFADAYARLTAAAQLGQRTGEIGLEIYALAGIAECRRIQGDYYRAAHEHIQLGERFRQLKDARGVVWALEGMGQILRMTGRRDSARRHFDKARRIAIAANDRRGLAYALKCHAECLADEGRFIEALEQSVFAVDLFSELGLAIGWAYAQKALGDIASLANEHALAAHAYSEARARFDSIGDDRGVAYMDVASGFLALRDSQWDVALLKAEIGRKMFLAAHIRLGVRRAERLAAAARARRLS